MTSGCWALNVGPRKYHSDPETQRSRLRSSVGKWQGYIACQRNSHFNRQEIQDHQTEFKVKGQGEGQTSENDACVSGVSVGPQIRTCIWERQGHRSSSWSSLKTRRRCIARHYRSSKIR